MIDRGFEKDRRRCIRIIMGEGKGELEFKILVRCVAWPVDGSSPRQKVTVRVGES